MSADNKNNSNSSSERGNREIQKILTSIHSKVTSEIPINLLCYIYDDNCALHEQMDTTIAGGKKVPHQESRDRVMKINGATHHTGLNALMVTAGSVSLQRSDILKIHDKDYLKEVEHYCKLNQEHCFANLDGDLDLSIKNFDSLSSIYAAVASVMGAVQLTCTDCQIGTGDIAKRYRDQGKIPPEFRSKFPRRVFCNVRPPGHHANSKHGAGFCFLNNVAIGARYAMDRYDHIKKVLIVDWDLHHGDGTQEIFAQSEHADQNVMYISLHRGPDFYPFTGTMADNETYQNVLNSPFPANSTISQYMERFNDVVLPAAYEFDPDLIFISAGFDSHRDDLYSELPLDYEDYSYMTRRLIDLAETCANGRIISVLEGGYTISVLIRSVMAHLATMIDHDGETTH
jgi:acetoin utilization deacetylase AcuC-like enzyme